MRTALVVPAAPLAKLVDRARGYAADGRAGSTKKAYLSDFRSFEAWCSSQGVAAMPARPELVALYATALADVGRRVSTIRSPDDRDIAKRRRPLVSPVPYEPYAIVVAEEKKAKRLVGDANILINLCHAGLLALLEQLSGYEFVVPGEVDAEITDPEQRRLVDELFARGTVKRQSLGSVGELAIYAELRTVMGSGEASCIALVSAFSKKRRNLSDSPAYAAGTAMG